MHWKERERGVRSEKEGVMSERNWVRSCLNCYFNDQFFNDQF